MALEPTEPRTVFPCNTCSLSFTSSEAQRSHMRTSWHLHNLQCKISSLLAISLPEYEAQGRQSAAVKRWNVWSSSDEAHHWASESQSCSDENGEIDEAISSGEEDESEELERYMSTSYEKRPTPPATTTTRCLFCPLTSSSTGENLSHMSGVHDFTLHPPSSSSEAQTATPATNLKPLLSYLSFVVFTHRECLYCGKRKGSVSGVQSHMRDKAHCRVERGDYGDFFGEDEERDEVEEGSRRVEVKKISGTELRLPSGVVVNSRRHRYEGGSATDGHVATFRPKATSRQRARRGRPVAAGTDTSASSPPPLSAPTHPSARSTALTTPPNHPPVPHPPQHTIATLPQSRSTALSLSGLSDSQLRSLATLDKKMRRQQGAAKKKVVYAAQQQPVKTVYYKTENPVYQAG